MTRDDPKQPRIGTDDSDADADGGFDTRDDFVEVAANVRMHLRDWGKGKSIVFVHGWPLCNEMFEYQFTQLALQGFRCVAPSLRGFGQSSQPWGEYDLNVFADDLRAILEVRYLQDVILAGFGMGGAVALRYMARHAGYRVSKLAFLAAAAPIWTKRANFPEGGPERPAVEKLIARCRANRAQLVADMIGKMFRTDVSFRPGLADWLFQLSMQASPHATAACLRTMAGADLRRDMASIKVATLILHGKHDRLVPFSIGRALAKGILGAQLVPLAHSGHALFWEEHEKVNAELARFAD